MTAIADVRALNEEHLDGLREVANIGAGHAAAALSQLVGSTVMISVPRIRVAPLRELPPVVDVYEEPVAAVLMHMMGDLSGRTLLVFPRDAALRLAEIMLMRPMASSSWLGELEQSAINEAGNILSSAYMNALSAFMGMILLPSPPRFAVDNSRDVLATAQLKTDVDECVLCVETEFSMRGSATTLHGFFLLLPSPESLNKILQALHLV
jgi:chemotaxis protein CheC